MLEEPLVFYPYWFISNSTNQDLYALLTLTFYLIICGKKGENR